MSGWDGQRDNASSVAGLFDPLPPQTPAWTRTRTEDPETSLIAAASVDMRAKYVDILTALSRFTKPATYHDFIDAPNYGRLTELHRAELVESVGTNGRKGRLWIITEAGRAALRGAA